MFWKFLILSHGVPNGDRRTHLNTFSMESLFDGVRPYVNT